MKSFSGAAVILLILLVISGASRNRTAKGLHGVQPGDVATFRYTRDVPIAPSQVDLRHYMNAVRNGEDAVARQLVDDGRVRLLFHRTRVRVGHMSGLGSMATVEDGEHRGFRGWVPTQWLLETE